MGRRSSPSCAAPRQLEELWAELNPPPKSSLTMPRRPRSAKPARTAAAVSSSRPRSAKPAPRRRSAGRRTGRKQDCLLLRLPLEAAQHILARLPAAAHLRLLHVCRELRATLLQTPAVAESFWQLVCEAHWGVDGGGSRALHCRQLEVVVANARLLCSPALRSALHVHYTTAPRAAGARGPPQLERCDSDAGCPAIYNTRTPLALCLLLDREGLILGLCIFVTFRFFVPDGADGEGHHRDVRSYLVLKRGQVVPPSAARRRASGPTARNEYRFRICGETSALAQGISSGETLAAVVQREALVELDPRKHSVAHALTHMDVEASSQQGATPLSSLVVATMAQTQSLIRKTTLKRAKKKEPARLL